MRSLRWSPFAWIFQSGIAKFGRRLCGLTSPTTMLPEILRRILAYPLLQDFAVASNHCVHVLVTIARFFNLNRLKDYPEPAIRQSKHVHKADACIQSQGEYRKSASGL